MQRIPEPKGNVVLTDLEKSGKGVVLATGPGKWMETEEGEWWRRPMTVHAGDLVYFTPRWNDAEGLGYQLGPDEVLIYEADVLAVLHHANIAHA